MSFAKCPCCAANISKRVHFTLWGGAIGPALMSLVQCAGCGVHYNGKSGNRVEKHIRMYTAVMLATLIMLAACVFYMYAGAGPLLPGTV